MWAPVVAPVVAGPVAAVGVALAGAGVEVRCVAAVGVVGEPDVDWGAAEGVGGVGVHGVRGEGSGGLGGSLVDFYEVVGGGRREVDRGSGIDEVAVVVGDFWGCGMVFCGPVDCRCILA